MSLVRAELFPKHLTLSTRLVSELGAAHSTLRATLRGCGSSVIIHAGGEVDATSERTWQALLGEAGALVTPPGLLVVDVNGLDFMGCCAYAALAEEAHRCRDRGADLCLVSRQTTVARIVAACRLSHLLPVYPSTDSALSAAADGVFRRLTLLRS